LLPRLEELILDDIGRLEWRSLLRPPHNLRWKSIGGTDFVLDDEIGALLGSLPSLTSLCVGEYSKSRVTCTSFEFLPSLSSLTALSFYFFDPNPNDPGFFIAVQQFEVDIDPYVDEDGYEVNDDGTTANDYCWDEDEDVDEDSDGDTDDDQKEQELDQNDQDATDVTEETGRVRLVNEVKEAAKAEKRRQSQETRRAETKANIQTRLIRKREYDLMMAQPRRVAQEEEIERRRAAEEVETERCREEVANAVAIAASFSDALHASCIRTQLRSLRLSGCTGKYTFINQDVLAACLPRFMVLEKLDLDVYKFNCLTFLTQGPITRTLTELTLRMSGRRQLRMRPADMQVCVSALRGLENLLLIGSVLHIGRQAHWRRSLPNLKSLSCFHS